MAMGTAMVQNLKMKCTMLKMAALIILALMIPQMMVPSDRLRIRQTPQVIYFYFNSISKLVLCYYFETHGILSDIFVTGLFLLESIHHSNELF